MINREVRVRFAPSPTGPLHVGGVRTALYNYLFAKKNKGKFLLRIEDTDQTRFVSGAEEYIIQSLEWLGLQYDEGPNKEGPYGPYRQSERKTMYAQYAYKLVERDLAYYAFDTAEELDTMREKLKAGNMLPKYDAASRMSMKNSLTLSKDEVKERLDRGDDFVIRIKLPRNEEVRFHDIIRGWVVFNTSQLDDKVLLKGDGMPTYHLANVVDDYLMKISHVIRGEEWLPSAPLHVMLYKFMGWESLMPEFAHLPLILKPDGHGKLSKRDGDRLGFPVFPLNWQDPVSSEISSGYREAGYLSEALINILAFLGWHPSDHRELFNLGDLIEAFSLERVSKSGAKFDQEKARWFNHQFIMRTPAEELQKLLEPQIKEMHLSRGKDYLLAVIELMKEKVNFAPDILSRGDFFFRDPQEYDPHVAAKKWNPEVASQLVSLAGELVRKSPVSGSAIEEIFNEFVNNTGQQKGGLMQALRWAVSGQAGGPPLFEMLALLGIEQIAGRIERAAQQFIAR